MAFYEINLFLTSTFWRDLAIIDKENYKKYQPLFYQRAKG